MRTKKAGSGGVLRSVDDTCHGSRSTQNRKPPLLPSFFPTRRRQACRSASPLLPLVQSGGRHCEIRSMRQQFIPPRRTWVLTRSDCSPTTCAPPTVHDSAGKIFNFALGRETYRTQYDSLITQGTYQRSRDRLSCKWPTTLRRSRRTCTLFWRRFPTVEVPNVEACFAISVRFKGEGGGWEWNLRSSFCKLLRTFATAPYVKPLTAMFYFTGSRTKEPLVLRTSVLVITLIPGIIHCLSFNLPVGWIIFFRVSKSCQLVLQKKRLSFFCRLVV